MYRERHKQLMAIRHYLRDLIDNVVGSWYTDNSRTTTYSDFVSKIDKWSQTSRRCVNYIMELPRFLGHELISDYATFAVA